MRVLLDECLPKKLKADFRDFKVMSVTEMGWAGKRNGQLLRLAEEKFDIFLTVDQNLRYQQNLKVFKIAVILLCVPNNRYEAIKPLIFKIRQAMDMAQAGKLICVGEDEDENFSTYESVIREGLEEYAAKKGKAIPTRLLQKRASGMMTT